MMHKRSGHRTSGSRKSAVRLALMTCILGIGWSAAAMAADDDDDDSKAKPAWPTTYLDLRTTYARIPAGSLPIGLGSPALVSALQSLALSKNAAVPTSLPLASRQGAALDIPLTFDVTDSVSLYGGVSATTTSTAGAGWSSVNITSWNVGLQAAVYQQNGGKIPTVTWQSTYTRTIPESPFATSNFNNVLEADYAFDKDETRGLLAGVQDVRVVTGTSLARIQSSDIFYIGGYYQWPNNWKFTGRLGVQYFGGAQLGALTAVQPFTEPAIRFDLDRMDDDDNRLFGVSVEIQWVPKPAYQLILRTPLYLLKN